MSEQTPITDVVFDFCGVLLDWQTRACLEGVLPQVFVDWICADDDPCGFFHYEDRMDAGEDLRTSIPMWFASTARRWRRCSGTTSSITGMRSPACCRGWSSCWAT